MYNISLFPLLALKVLKDATMHTTWLQSPSSRPTAQCGTRLSLSPASRWHTCCPASLWSERSRRSSVPVQTAWAKPSEQTGLTGCSSSVTGYWLCSIHPNSINLNILDSFTIIMSLKAKGKDLFSSSSPSCFPPMRLAFSFLWLPFVSHCLWSFWTGKSESF